MAPGIANTIPGPSTLGTKYIDGYMAEPQLTILGVYRPVVSAETWQEQLNVTGDEDYTKRHFDKLVLIEALVEDLEEPFDMEKFGQMDIEFPADPRRMQVGYDEGLLSSDGELLIERDMNCVHGSGPLRFAVYLHLFDPNRPLLWQRGEVTAQPVQEVPIRLAMLMPYNACS
jgi:hypothetical protein